jgi:uncharacterized protein YegL
MVDRIPIPAPNQRVLVVLCMDTSYSMRGEAINRLNEAMQGWSRSMGNHSMAAATEFALITFGADGVRKWRGGESFDPRSDRTPFMPAKEFRPPRLTADGVTPLTAAVRLSVDVIEARKRQLQQQRINWRRPLIWLVTDGRPTDDAGNFTADWKPLVGEIRTLERNRKLTLFAIGIPPIDDEGQNTLRELAPDNYRIYGEFDFNDILILLERSVEDPTRSIRDAPWKQA